MVTGVYRSNKSQKPAVKQINPSKKQSVKRKLNEQVNESQKTLQDKTAKKQKQYSNVIPINESELTEEITKHTLDINPSDITENVSVEPVAEVDPENVSEDDKSDDMPLAVLKTKASEVQSKPTDDIRRQSEDISEDDIPLATVKAKLEEKIKLVEDLSDNLPKPSLTSQSCHQHISSSISISNIDVAKNALTTTKEISKSVETTKEKESDPSLSLIPDKDSAKENISNAQCKTNQLDCPSNDDIPLSEALLTKPFEVVREDKTPSAKQNISASIQEVEQVKEVFAEPAKVKPTEAKVVPDKPALVKSAVAKTDEVKSDAKKVDELMASPTTEPVAAKTVAAKTVATKTVAAKPVPSVTVASKTVVCKTVAPKSMAETKPAPPVSETKPVPPVAVKRVIVKTVAKKSTPTQSVARTVAVEPTIKSSTTSKPSVPTPAKSSTNASIPIKSTSVEVKSPAIKSTDSKPVEITVVPVIDLTDSADAVKQEIDDPEFDAARVADRRKSLNELIDLCSDTSSEPPNRSPASSTSCKRYKDYDNIDEQLEADMEREQQYFDGVDEAHDRNLWNPLDEEQLPSSKFK